jgi:hypothetical protein
MTEASALYLGILSETLNSHRANIPYCAPGLALGANDSLAANLVMTTTLVCILSCSIGLFFLKVRL